jgi:hypothetical protein
MHLESSQGSCTRVGALILSKDVHRATGGVAELYGQAQVISKPRAAGRVQVVSSYRRPVRARFCNVSDHDIRWWGIPWHSIMHTCIHVSMENLIFSLPIGV